MIQFNHFFPLHLFLVLLPSVSSIQSSPLCNPSCGLLVIPYPFGFSESCKISLNCTHGKSQIDKFTAKVTPDSIQVNLPAKCNRPIQGIAPLFSRHYAPSLRNALLLQNCTTKPSDCGMPKALLESQFMLGGCELPVCYSGGKGSMINGCMKFSDLKNSSCMFMYSSVAINGDNTTSLVSLDLQTVQLEWWLEGKCNCSSNAKCVEIASPSPEMSRFRCKCGEGFHGVAGNGCLKVSGNRKRRSALLKRIIFVVGGITCLALFCLFVYLFGRKTTRRRPSSSTSWEVTFLKVSYEDLLKGTDGFSSANLIGAGSYGSVYMAVLEGRVVAVKVLDLNRHGASKSFMAECEILSSIRHRNLVKILTSCSSINFRVKRLWL